MHFTMRKNVTTEQRMDWRTRSQRHHRPPARYRRRAANLTKEARRARDADDRRHLLDLA